MTTYRLEWQRVDTKEKGFLPDVYRTLREARKWARDWTQTMLDLDPKRKTEIRFTVIAQSRIK